MIKYEELLSQSYVVFLDIIQFINKTFGKNEKINKDKIKKILNSTSFETLKKNEQNFGFSEAVPVRGDKNKKIPFFNLGPKNDWKKILENSMQNKIKETFSSDMKELCYD